MFCFHRCVTLYSSKRVKEEIRKMEVEGSADLSACAPQHKYCDSLSLLRIYQAHY